MDQDANPTSAAAPALPRLPLDAYPRLCGLPVTIERLVPTTGAIAPAERVTPARRAGPKRHVARAACVLLVVVAMVLVVASEARAQAPLPSVQAGAA
jgi:hypothetical protein